MKSLFMLLVFGAVACLLYVQMENNGFKVFDNSLSTPLSLGKSRSDSQYKEDILGRWYMTPRVEDGYTLSASIVYLKDSTFILDIDIGSQYGSQDLVAKGKYRIRKGKVFTDISEIHPIELTRIQPVKSLIDSYTDKIILLTDSELTIGGNRKQHQLELRK